MIDREQLTDIIESPAHAKIANLVVDACAMVSATPSISGLTRQELLTVIFEHDQNPWRLIPITTVSEIRDALDVISAAWVDLINLLSASENMEQVRTVLAMTKAPEDN